MSALRWMRSVRNAIRCLAPRSASRRASTSDGSGIGFGLRSQRYAIVIDDGVVSSLHVEQPMKFEVSSAEAVLAAL